MDKSIQVKLLVNKLLSFINFYDLEYELLCILYFAYIHSVLTYGIVLWINSTSTTPVFKLQKRGIRTIYKKKSVVLQQRLTHLVCMYVCIN